MFYIALAYTNNIPHYSAGINGKGIKNEPLHCSDPQKFLSNYTLCVHGGDHSLEARDIRARHIVAGHTVSRGCVV